jgi:hypothetical protein
MTSDEKVDKSAIEQHQLQGVLLRVFYLSGVRAARPDLLEMHPHVFAFGYVSAEAARFHAPRITIR